MPYYTEGTLTTDIREVAIDTTWDTQTDWEAYQSATNVDITNGVVSLAEQTISDKAIHRWIVSEGSGSTIADSIGTQDATVTGATWSSDTWQGGYAMDFDGTDDSVSSGYTAAFDNPPFAVGVTIELDTASEEQRIIDLFEGGNIGWMIRTSGGGDNIEFNYVGSGGANPITGSTSLSTGVKYRVLVNFAPSGDVEIYLNNSSEASATGQGYTATSGGLDFLWGDNNQGGFNLDGRMDDVIFYDSILDASEIEADYNAQPWV